MTGWLRKVPRHRSTTAPRETRSTLDPEAEDWRLTLRGGRRDDAIAVFVGLVVAATLVLGGIALANLFAGLLP